jgi:hypothetical protein
VQFGFIRVPLPTTVAVYSDVNKGVKIKPSKLVMSFLMFAMA